MNHAMIGSLLRVSPVWYTEAISASTNWSLSGGEGVVFTPGTELDWIALEFCVCVVGPVGTGLFSTFTLCRLWGVLLESPAFSSCWILFNSWLAILALWMADWMISSGCFQRYNFFTLGSATSFSSWMARHFYWAASFSTTAQWSAVDLIFC